MRRGTVENGYSIKDSFVIHYADIDSILEKERARVDLYFRGIFQEEVSSDDAENFS